MTGRGFRRGKSGMPAMEPLHLAPPSPSLPRGAGEGAPSQDIRSRDPPLPLRGGGVRGGEGIQTPRAEKQPKKQNPGNPPGVYNLHHVSGSQETCKQFSYSTNRTTPTPGKPAKQLQQKTTEQHVPTTPPVSLLEPTSRLQDLQNIPSRPTSSFPNQLQKRTSSAANHPIPPTCSSPPTGLQKRTSGTANHPTHPTASFQIELQKKNFRYFKPPLPNPTASLRLQTCNR
jgi:hypothetical protein